MIEGIPRTLLTSLYLQFVRVLQGLVFGDVDDVCEESPFFCFHLVQFLGGELGFDSRKVGFRDRKLLGCVLVLCAQVLCCGWRQTARSRWMLETHVCYGPDGRSNRHTRR